uniref:Uncharacterized protein n=1 Tax=Arundo donax TaxID=35708 RepID=A0A0A9EBK4_ARUDO
MDRITSFSKPTMSMMASTTFCTIVFRVSGLPASISLSSSETDASIVLEGSSLCSKLPCAKAHLRTCKVASVSIHSRWHIFGHFPQEA